MSKLKYFCAIIAFAFTAALASAHAFFIASLIVIQNLSDNFLDPLNNFHALFIISDKLYFFILFSPLSFSDIIIPRIACDVNR